MCVILIATITLNRPDHMNAISLEMPSEIRKAVKIADVDDEVHCIIIQGNGRGFSVGYDLKEFAGEVFQLRKKFFATNEA